MSLADFQNPIANSPLVTQHTGAQHIQTANVPQQLSQDQLQADIQRANTVDESDESKDRDGIREDETRERDRDPTRRRARKHAAEKDESPSPPIQDGIHGGQIDIRA